MVEPQAASKRERLDLDGLRRFAIESDDVPTQWSGPVMALHARWTSR